MWVSRRETTGVPHRNPATRWIALVAFGTLAAAPSLASAWSVDTGAFAEWHPLSATNELGKPEGLGEAGSGSLLAGLRFGVGLFRGVRLELEGAYGQTTLPYAVGTEVSRADATLLTARALLRGGVAFGRFEPFAFIGGGITRSSSDTKDPALQDLDGTSLLGVGVELRLWSRLHLRLDGRFHLVGTTVPGESTASEAAATLGLTWRLGGETPRPPDADNDDVPDATDRCPYEAETHNGVRDEDGCPEHPEVVKRYHRTHYARDDKSGVVATLKAPRVAAAPVSPAASAAPAAPLPRVATDTDDRLLDKLDPPLPLADNALPPLVSGGDDDGDGLMRDEDVCPSEPEDVDAFEDADGCPDADNDSDAVLDALDLCPFEPETQNGVRDEDGCPESPLVVQRYHRTRFRRDGSVGTVAFLPKTVTPTAAVPMVQPVADPTDALPEPLPLAKGALPALVSAGDDDGDGLERKDDVCPSEPEDFDSFEDGDGCPDFDDDQDGVADAADKCRREGETRNGYEDGDGCPDDLPQPLEERIGRIDGLVFASNSAKILEESEASMLRLLSVMQKYPAIQVEIGGHTDDSGNPDRNKMLSSLRAEAVRAWLVSKGIDAQRIAAHGYGPSKPVASNKTPAGRAANRRVEFQLVVGTTQTMTKE